MYIVHSSQVLFENSSNLFVIEFSGTLNNPPPTPSLALGSLSMALPASQPIVYIFYYVKFAMLFDEAYTDSHF